MGATKKYLAFDLGAESGRAVAGLFDGRRLELDLLHRFPNGPVDVCGTLYWDILGIFRELKQGARACAARHGAVDCLATDSWGVDFGLLDRSGQLLANPLHYRDRRNDGAPERLFRSVPRERVFSATGIQVMQFNTLFQLHGLAQERSPLLGAADCLLQIAELVNYFFCGEKAAEYTNASTSQMLNAATRQYDLELLRAAGIPTHFLPRIVEPGTRLGAVLPAVAEECGLGRVPVAAVACHDTGSAVAAAPAQGRDWLYLSSGTWSLLGAELDAPVVNERSAAYNFTNEGGVCGTIRFLKNIMGLWILQECKREWAREGEDLDYDALTSLAAAAAPFGAVIDPCDEFFFAPGGMPERIAAYCRRTGQTPPQGKGAVVRAVLESLALAYRRTARQLQETVGGEYRTLHIVGGGARNRLLDQFAADATGMRVLAGPVEATAYGNCLLQAMALGDVSGLAEAREIAARSCAPEAFEPEPDPRWDEAFGKLLELRK